MRDFEIVKQVKIYKERLANPIPNQIDYSGLENVSQEKECNCTCKCCVEKRSSK